MSTVGSESNPARIAIIGAGPAGFYAAERFFRTADLHVFVDVYDRLPTPHGLVRAGVAPDHEKIKNVTRVFDKTASNPDFRFFGNVEYGSHVSLDDLKRFYHQVYFSTGAQVDRRLGIPGENLPRSHSATEFVAWYNGHPDYRDLEFDLSQEQVAIIGMGNVAVDVARILAKTVDELAGTDITDYALEALAESKVKDIFMIGRRGPAQTAFTTPEIKEMGELADASTVVLADEFELDPVSAAALEESPDRMTSKKLEIMAAFVGGSLPGAKRNCHLRFLLSPTELIAGNDGGVSSMRLVRNRLELQDGGRIGCTPTETEIELPVGLVFRSVGYRGVALPGLPFNDSWGVVRNEFGRVVDDSGNTCVGCYVGGWIKRGPTGVIGTNKPDAFETVDLMIEDLSAGKHFDPESTDSESIQSFVHDRQPHLISYDDWLQIDAAERTAGESRDRPRVKFTSVEEMLEVLERD
ncbi:MAG: FAD-dependent oxidoreductase [Bacteroidetes bacterium]|nr:FAD-dependent oxidoreductase [Bacteroidota bacterium]MCH8245903.1 FAD-dependent oxidoreductase [Bacteroidota bacterium]